MTPPAPLEAAVQACARAEHAKWCAILSEHEGQTARIEADSSAMRKRMAVNAVALDIALHLHLSEQTVWGIVEKSKRLREHAPAVWAMFGDGLVDAARASIVASFLDRATLPETRDGIDRVAAQYAPDHTAAELRRRLERLMDRLEPIEVDQAEAAKAERRVSVEPDEHGMSHVNAYVPTIVAIAAYKRLRKAAKQLPDDGRTLDQKVADLYAAWLTNATGTESDVKAEVAIVVEAAALAGITDTNAVVDDEASIPVPWLLAFAQASAHSTLWLRLLTDRRGHVLDVTRIGYLAALEVRRAIQWRDGTCRVRGCHRKAEACDLDHEHPYAAGGPTSGLNLRCLCRRHHGIKGHGLLPADAIGPPQFHLVQIPGPDITVEYIAA